MRKFVDARDSKISWKHPSQTVVMEFPPAMNPSSSYGQEKELIVNPRKRSESISDLETTVFSRPARTRKLVDSSLPPPLPRAASVKTIRGLYDGDVAEITVSRSDVEFSLSTPPSVSWQSLPSVRSNRLPPVPIPTSSATLRSHVRQLGAPPQTSATEKLEIADALVVSSTARFSRIYWVALVMFCLFWVYFQFGESPEDYSVKRDEVVVDASLWEPDVDESQLRTAGDDGGSLKSERVMRANEHISEGDAGTLLLLGRRQEALVLYRKLAAMPNPSDGVVAMVWVLEQEAPP